MPGKKVCIIGSGNWGTTVAKMVGTNVPGMPDFEPNVNMYVYEEVINGRKLSEIINTDHENVKYLPGKKLPHNVVAVTDIVEAARDADWLFFVVPHQFLKAQLKMLKGKIKPTVTVFSFIKGLLEDERGIVRCTEVIEKELEVRCGVVCGANLATEIADELFSEATIGSVDIAKGHALKRLLQTPYFRLVVTHDVAGVELCGALKNIVAVGAGLADGLGYKDNTKSAIIRLGLMEMIRFCEIFYPSVLRSTFFESCGGADLITTCYGGRNRKVAEQFALTGKSLETLEKELLGGQKLQGPATADEVQILLRQCGMEQRFPLFTMIHLILKGDVPVAQFIDCVKNHPEHAVF